MMEVEERTASTLAKLELVKEIKYVTYYYCKTNCLHLNCLTIPFLQIKNYANVKNERTAFGRD